VIGVVLSFFELYRAAMIGLGRCVVAVENGWQLEDGRIGCGWGEHVVGAIGEYAWSLGQGELWRPIIHPTERDGKHRDVAGVQVRTTERANGCLIIRPGKDDPRDLFGLAVLDAPNVRLFGPVHGERVTEDRFWRDVNPARGIHRAGWFVPQDVVEAEAIFERLF
jgi:hypothetical protein